MPFYFCNISSSKNSKKLHTLSHISIASLSVLCLQVYLILKGKQQKRVSSHSFTQPLHTQVHIPTASFIASCPINNWHPGEGAPGVPGGGVSHRSLTDSTR